MGKAIPNAEILVVREDGSPCAPGEPGELVHRGALSRWVTGTTASAPPSASARPLASPRACPIRNWRSGPGTRSRRDAGRLPLLHRPQGRDDQDLGLPGQPHRGRGGGLRHRAGGGGGGHRRAPRDPGPGHRRGRQGRPGPGGRRHRPGDPPPGALPPGTARLHGPAPGPGPGRPAAQPQRQDRPQVPGHAPWRTCSRRRPPDVRATAGQAQPRPAGGGPLRRRGTPHRRASRCADWPPGWAAPPSTPTTAGPWTGASPSGGRPCRSGCPCTTPSRPTPCRRWWSTWPRSGGRLRRRLPGGADRRPGRRHGAAPDQLRRPRQDRRGADAPPSPPASPCTWSPPGRWSAPPAPAPPWGCARRWRSGSTRTSS